MKSPLSPPFEGHVYGIHTDGRVYRVPKRGAKRHYLTRKDFLNLRLSDPKLFAWLSEHAVSHKVVPKHTQELEALAAVLAQIEDLSPDSQLAVLTAALAEVSK